MPPPGNPNPAARPERLDRFETGYAGSLPKLRPDLILTEQQIAGRTNYIIKDPISLRYFRVERQELALASLLDGKRNARIIREQLTEQFPDFDLTDDKILRFVNSLSGYGFLLIPGERTLQFIEASRAAKNKRSYQLTSYTSKFLYFRYSVYDPDKLFKRMATALRFIWTKTFGILSVAFILFGLTLVLLHWHEFTERKINFFTFHNLFLAWALYVVTKVIHEFGHGLTCKHYGAEVHEIGMLLIVLTPCFYVDVSDAWMVRNKWHRVLITLAGIYVEVMMASAAAIVWINTEPGLTNQVAFNLMVLCSISTIVFNANPLLRYDGYYIASDWMEVPNLRLRSSQYVNALLSKLLFGKSIDVAAMTGSNRHLFMVYAVASYIYGIFIILIIAFFFQRMLEPVGLGHLGTLLGMISLSTFFIMPFIQLASATRKAAADRQTTVYGLFVESGHARRPVLTIGLLVTALVAVTFIPSHFSVQRSCVVQALESKMVRTVQPGFLREVLVREGDTVQAGQPIAVLQNREAVATRDDVRDQLSVMDVVCKKATAVSDYGSLRQVLLQRQQLQLKLEKAEREVSELTLRAPISGTVVTPRLHDLVNRFLRRGDTFCTIAPLDRIRVIIPISETEASHVKTGNAASLLVVARAWQRFDGHVANDPLALVKRDLDPALTSQLGGDVPMQIDPQQGREVPSVNTYLAELEIANTDRWLRPGMTGRAEIVGAPTTLGGLAARYFWDSFTLDYRL